MKYIFYILFTVFPIFSMNRRCSEEWNIIYHKLNQRQKSNLTSRRVNLVSRSQSCPELETLQRDQIKKDFITINIPAITGGVIESPKNRDRKEIKKILIIGGCGLGGVVIASLIAGAVTLIVHFA